MQLLSNPAAGDAHAQLVLQLCEALSNFVAATAGDGGTVQEPAPDGPANDDHAPQRTRIGFDDIISLKGILSEFGLTQPQVMTLRKSCGFPEPIGPTRPLVFQRDEVERWIRSHPNSRTSAIVLIGRQRIPRRS
jgi:predicted DNA-binding transcriptional regulator AlpA